MTILARSDAPKVNQVQMKSKCLNAQIERIQLNFDLKFACLPVGRDFDIKRINWMIKRPK